MLMRIGPTQKTLWPHVGQPPGQSFVVYFHAVSLQHDEAVRSDCYEQSKGFDLPCAVDAVDRYVGETPKSIPQGVSGGTGGT
jgi:hypothetical protein